MTSQFKKPRCSHRSTPYTDVCRHIHFERVVDGIKHYTGNEWERTYRCEECEKEDRPPTCQLCAQCIARIESDGSWSVTGTPGIKRKPEPFRFSSRSVSLDDLPTERIQQICPLPNHISEVLIFTPNGELWRACLAFGSTRLLTRIAEAELNPQGEVVIVVSENQEYAAITSAMKDSPGPRGNRGVVIDLDTGEKVMDLTCGDYHVELAPFPVAFFEDKGRTLLIHATDWNHLDITDLRTQECFTKRDPDNAPDADDENIVFTEWSGQLLVSPDQQRVATIGWVWHPVGVAFSWNIHDWLNNNVWEADLGPSKRHYATWEYFWHGPFFWRDNETLCLWGAPELHTERDVPLDSVVLFDVDSEQQLNVFYGPTIDVFYYDTYLFSGNPEGNGITVWSVDEGALLHEQIGIKPIGYIAQTKEFIEKNEKGLVLWQWERVFH